MARTLEKPPTGSQVAERARRDLGYIDVSVRRAEDYLKSDKLFEADQMLKDVKRKMNELDLWLTLYIDDDVEQSDE